MPDAPISKDMFQEGILKQPQALTAYLPLVGAAGGLAFCRTQDRHPLHPYFLKVCVVCAFVPVLNSAFYRPQLQLLRPLVLYTDPCAVRRHLLPALPPGLGRSATCRAPLG